MTGNWPKVLEAVVVSAVVVGGVLFLAWGAARWLSPISQGRRTVLQLAGAALTFWGVFAKLGWTIQTSDGTTSPEVFNLWFFRILTGLGMALLAFATLVKTADG